MRKLLLLLFTPWSLLAQTKSNDQISVVSKAGLMVATDNTPFLLRNDQYGLVPITANFIYLNTSLIKNYDSSRVTKFDWGAGIEAHLNVGKTTQLLLPQAYVKAKWRSLEIYGGRRKEVVGIVDTTLTSGSYIWSGNALPMTKIQIGFPDYVNILPNKILSIKWAYAHGWFNNDRPVTSDILLHQKWLYVKLGKPTWHINVFAGVNHHAQWAGSGPLFATEGKYPAGWKNYWHVVKGSSAAITGNLHTSDFDANRIGNHLGSVDLGMLLNTSFSKISIYRQSFYEDGSLFYLINITDGLTGLSFDFKKGGVIKKVLFEYLATNNQGGETFLLGNGAVEELRGRDNYFNNGQYLDGWTNKRNIIGTPFINEIRTPLSDSTYRIDNNRVKVFYLAISGNILKNHPYVAKISHSYNYGSYSRPFNETRNSTSFLFRVQKPLRARNSFLHLSTGFDLGSLTEPTWGFNASWIKQW